MNPKRQAQIDALRHAQDQGMTAIYREARAYGPVGRFTEWNDVLGAHIPRGKKAVYVPGFGTWVFKSKSCPEENTVIGWQAVYLRCQAWSKEETRLSQMFMVVRMGCVVGNKCPMETLQQAEKEDMLDADEIAYLRKLETFWSEHPNAKTGVVTSGGIIDVEEYHKRSA